MQYLNIFALAAISLLQPAFSQTIDPSTVSDDTKSMLDVDLQNV